ncbi:MAG: MFS transporter [Anaerovibrio sp.]
MEEVFQVHTEISLGYSARQGTDGNFYVLDNGHERLLCFDKMGKVQFTIENPADRKSELLYIDDFAVTDDGIYLSATEWDGMSIAREVILHYDGQGKYVDTLVERDYAELPTNKHRFYGISVKDGEVRYGECLSDSIVSGNMEIPYANAFNGVSDIVFADDAMYVLNKNGTIRMFTGNDTVGTEIYCLAAEKDKDVVPYRMSANKYGSIYFTDIRNQQVRLVNRQTKCSDVVFNETASLTANVTDENELLLLDEAGLLVANNENAKTYIKYLTLQKSVADILFQVVWFLALLLSVALSLLLFARLIYQLSKKQYSMPQIVSFWVLGTVSVISLLLCSMLLNSFADSYREKIEEQVKSAAYMVASQTSGSDIKQIEAKGGFGGEAYNRLCHLMEQSFANDVAFYKQLYCNILKLSEDGQDGYAVAYLDQSIGAYFPLNEVEKEELVKVYQTGEAVWNQEVNDISGTYLSVKVPVYDAQGAVCGAVAVGVETYVITDTIQAMLIHILISIAILLMLVWLISVEAMSFANNYDIYKKNVAAGEPDVLPGHLLRLLVFLVFVAYNMTATFLPVYLMRTTDAFPAAMREMAAALPITINIFLIGVMSLLCANLVRKFGIKKIMAISALCAFAGNLCIFLLPDFYMICFGLVLDGIGVGMVTNAIYVMLTYIKDEVNRTWGLTAYNGACLSGINFGMMLGSMLAITVGQHMVFCIVAVTWLLMVLLSGNLVRQMEGMTGHGEMEADASGDPEAQASISSWRFVTSKSVLSFMALVQNPYIIFGSFVFYYVPIYCSDHGYSETVCSILIMLYSQVAVLGSDRLTAWMSKITGHYAMYLAMGMNIAALLVFASFDNMPGLVVALLVMGISAAYGKPVQQNYYLGLDRAKQYGEDKSIGIYNFTENIGESLGPMVFGRMMISANFSVALKLFCCIVAGAGFIHYIICRKEFRNGRKKQ